MAFQKPDTKMLLGIFVALFIGNTTYSVINIFIYHSRTFWGWIGTALGLAFNLIGIFAFYNLYNLIPSISDFTGWKVAIKSDEEMIVDLEKK